VKITGKQLFRLIMETRDKRLIRDPKSMDYPATASEYAKQVNAERGSDSTFKLVEDQDHWDAMGIKTGYDLAHYFAVSTHRDAYRDAFGIRPRWMPYEDMTIDEIENDISNIFDAMDDRGPAFPEEHLFDDEVPTSDYEPTRLTTYGGVDAGPAAAMSQRGFSMEPVEKIGTGEEFEKYPKRGPKKSRGRRQTESIRSIIRDELTKLSELKK
jgi:hypothetical protein